MKLLSRVPAAAVFSAAMLITTSAAQAHFIWLVPETKDGQTTVQVYFGEDASPDDPALLDRLKGMVVQQLTSGAEPQTVELTRGEETLSGTLPANAATISLFVGSHDFGVFDRGDAVFRLKYYAKGGPVLGQPAWTEIDCSQLLPLDVVPTIDGDTIRVQVRFEGKPVAGAEVKASGPGMDDFAGVTDDEGRASFTMAEDGLYSIRARHIEQSKGEVGGKSYNDVRHYSTVSVEAQSDSTNVANHQLPALPEAVTSFGAAISDGYLYTYGGHTGSAHSYSMAEQGQELRRVALDGGEWEIVAEGPPLQGLALVAHDGKLYRIGGFTAKNDEGEEHDLWSQDDVARFDPKTQEWTDLPPLPEPRSSFDAAVVGDTIYVVGGWAMAGEEEHDWHETAWAMDLSQDRLAWKPLPSAPFRRRAMAAAAHNGKLYVIGGMQQEGGPTTQVAIFDPASGAWSEGPALVTVEEEQDGDADQRRSRFGGSMTGFGASAFATGGRLYVSTIKGNLQRLSEDGSTWEVIAETPTARFFHRMLPVGEGRLLMVGGANMQVGKFEEIEVLNVD